MQCGVARDPCGGSVPPAQLGRGAVRVRDLQPEAAVPPGHRGPDDVQPAEVGHRVVRQAAKLVALRPAGAQSGHQVRSGLPQCGTARHSESDLVRRHVPFPSE